jgi:hypothetical protein
MFRNVTLKCLTEISGISISQYPQYENAIKDMFRDTLKQLQQVGPIPVVVTFCMD